MNSSSSRMSPPLSETESRARHRYSHRWKRLRKVTEEIMNDNKLPACSPWGPLGCSRQKGVKIFQERRQSESSACRWRLRTAAKDPQLSTSVFVGVEVYVSTCVRGRCARVYVCVCVGGGANRIPRPCYCLGFLKVTMCLETPLPVLPLWATSWPLLPPPAVTVCTPRGLPKPSPTHTSSQNLRASHQVTLGVKTQFMAKEHEISGPRCRGTGIHTQWCQTPKLYSLPGTRTRWQKGLLSSLMVERWSGPSARKGLKSHTGWEICTKGVLLVLRLNSTAGPVGLRVPSFTVAQLLRVHNREEEWGRQSPPQAHKWEKDGFSWLTQTGSRGYLGMEPPGRLIWNASKRISCFKESAPWGRSWTWVWEGDERAGIQAVLPPPPQAREGLFNPSGVLCAFLVELVCGLVKRYL